MIRTSANYSSYGKLKTLGSNAGNYCTKPPSTKHVCSTFNEYFKWFPCISGNILSKSLPSETLLKMCKDKEQLSKTADGVTFEIKSLSSTAATSNSTSKLWRTDSSLKTSGNNVDCKFSNFGSFLLKTLIDC